MNSTKAMLANRVPVFCLAATVSFLGGLSTLGQSIQHLSTPVLGGLPGIPVMTGMSTGTNGVTITWDGPNGAYQLYQKGAGAGAKWQPVGTPNGTRRLTVPASGGQAFFKVLGPTGQYAGQSACLECHQPIHDSMMGTAHAQAFASLKRIGQHTNPSCLPCHTAGYGVPGGFVSEGATPDLAGVQCENCHGAAASHAANPDDVLSRPRIEVAATVCGGCHTGTQHPTFEEWSSSGHPKVSFDLNPSDKINACGRCHSGSVRVNMLIGRKLPAGDANISIGCVTCHDPHQATGNPAQLRNPVATTNDYSMSPTDNFATKYNPQVNVCAQCHNHAGASWTDSSAPPHYSPQYNMVLGTAGVLASGTSPNRPGMHVQIDKLCVGCHMPSKPYTSDTQPAATGHKFKPESYAVCNSCHGLNETDQADLVAFAKASIYYRMQKVKSTLDQWANTSRGAAALRPNYGARSWEYSVPGEFYAGQSAPTSAEQATIPANIKIARFNLYTVLYDKSYGVHNPMLAITLLQTAQACVEAELNN